MAGPWEKYQQPAPVAAGPWNKYSAAPAEEIKSLPDIVVKAPERTVFERVNDFGNDLGDSFAHHVGNIPVAGAQLVGHGIGSVAGALLSPENSIRQAIEGTNANFDDFAKRRETDYQATVPDSLGSYLGAGVGEVLPWVTGLGELRAAGAIPQASTLLGKLGTLAAEGGTMGALMPATGDGSFAGQKALQIGGGAASGPALYGAGRFIGGAASGVRDIAQHVTNPQAIADKNILGLFGSSPETLAKLRTAPQFVAGESPSAAQVLATPEAVKAERLLRNNPNAGASFADADNTNNAARQAIVSRLAGTPDEMTAAIAARKANAAPFIESSLTRSQPAARWGGAKNAFQNVLDNPARLPKEDFDAVKSAKSIVDKVRSGTLQEDDAMEELGHLAASVRTQKAQQAFSAATDAIDKNLVDPSGVLHTIATIRNGPLGVNPKVAEGLDFLTKQISGTQNIRGKVGTDVLDAVRQQASRLLGNAKIPGSAVGTQQGVALGPVKNQIVEAIERVAPGYRDYVAGYRKDSLPINTMQSVGRLADPNAPGSLNTAGDPQLAISRLRQVLRGDDKARFPMSDDARDQLDLVRQSLLRRTISNNPIAASGPATAADLQAGQGTALGSMIFGSPLSGKPGVATRAVGTTAGGSLGALLGGGVPGAIFGSAVGSLLPEAAGKVNAGIASRVGATAADSNATADAIMRALGGQKDPSRVSGALQRLLFGTEQGAPQSKLAQARLEWDTQMQQARNAVPKDQPVPEVLWRGALDRTAAKYGVQPQALLGGP